MGRLRAYGNAIVPQVAAEFIAAASECIGMNAPLNPKTIEPLLHTATGEPPQAGMGKFFRDDQGEVFEPHRPEHRSSVAIIGVLELDNGKWLARDNGFRITNPQFETREEALRYSIARRIKKFRTFGRQEMGEHWPEGIVNRMVEWALSLKPQKQYLFHEGGAAVESVIGHQSTGDEGEPAAHGAPAHGQCESDGDADLSAGSPSLLRSGDRAESQTAPRENDPNKTDPVIAELVAQHKARKFYPAGHTISMTSAVEGDAALSVATCQCGEVYKFPPSQHLKMDAAIELHWQKFDDLPDKTDGRGRPLVEGFFCAKGEDCHCQVVDAEHTFAHAAAKRERCGNWRKQDEYLAGITAKLKSDAIPPTDTTASPEPAPGDAAGAGSPSSDELDPDDPDYLLKLAATLAWSDEDLTGGGQPNSGRLKSSDQIRTVSSAAAMARR